MLIRTFTMYTSFIFTFFFNVPYAKRIFVVAIVVHVYHSVNKLINYCMDTANKDEAILEK